MNDKHLFTLDVVSGIDDEIVDRNLKKRFDLWFKKGKRKPIRWIPIIAAAACLCVVVGVLTLLMPGGNGKQVPVYLGMTVGTESPVTDEAPTLSVQPAYPQFSLLSAPVGTVPSYSFSLLDETDGPKLPDPGNQKDEDKPTPQGPGKEEASAPDIVFGETYYALKNEDIYIYIHLSNPDEFEILSFTLNGKKYSSNMFEYGSDLQTLILKYNVGDVNGLQEYTIDAIKYVDGEKIKNVRMEGDKTVKVYVNDETDVLQFNAQLSFTTLTITPTKKPLTLALYEGETLLRELSPTATEITDLPFDKRLILRATYSDGTQTRTAQHIFDTQALSKGLIIDENGIIRGMGSCTDTVLYIDNPVGDEAFASIKSIVEVHMGSGVTSVGYKGFWGCSGLTTVTLPDNLTSLGDSVFSNCTSLKSIVLPETIYEIPQNAFNLCSSLTSITLPDTLVSIGNGAFNSCAALQEINFPADLTYIGEKAFFACTSLSNITVPGGIEAIKYFAFNGSHDPSSLQSITILYGVKTIEHAALADNPELTEVILPASITYLGYNIFNLCPKLSELYFEGTKAQWKGISKDANWRGSQNNLTVVHCSDGDVYV